VVVRNFAAYFELKPSYNVGAESEDGRDLHIVNGTLWIFYLEVVVGAAGLFLRRKNDAVRLLFIQAAYFTAASLFFIAVPRLRAPIDLTLAVGVGCFAEWAGTRFGRQPPDHLETRRTCRPRRAARRQRAPWWRSHRPTSNGRRLAPPSRGTTSREHPSPARACCAVRQSISDSLGRCSERPGLGGGADLPIGRRAQDEHHAANGHDTVDSKAPARPPIAAESRWGPCRVGHPWMTEPIEEGGSSARPGDRHGRRKNGLVTLLAARPAYRAAHSDSHAVRRSEIAAAGEEERIVTVVRQH